VDRMLIGEPLFFKPGKLAKQSDVMKAGENSL